MPTRDLSRTDNLPLSGRGDRRRDQSSIGACLYVLALNGDPVGGRMKLLAPPIRPLEGSTQPQKIHTVIFDDGVQHEPTHPCSNPAHGRACWVDDLGNHVIRLSWHV